MSKHSSSCYMHSGDEAGDGGESGSECARNCGGNVQMAGRWQNNLCQKCMRADVAVLCDSQPRPTANRRLCAKCLQTFWKRYEAYNTLNRCRCLQ